jgi:hypothetical protein
VEEEQFNGKRSSDEWEKVRKEEREREKKPLFKGSLLEMF